MTHPFLDDRVKQIFTEAVSEEVLLQWPDYATFTPWLPLDDAEHDVRNNGQGKYDIGDYQGIYIVALFESDADIPADGADPFHPCVTYIGRTRTAPLKRRWYQYRRALLGYRSHSGGSSFFIEHLRDAQDPEEVRRRMRIAGLPVWLGEGDAPDRRAISFRTALLEAALVEAVYWEQQARDDVRLLNKA